MHPLRFLTFLLRYAYHMFCLTVLNSFRSCYSSSPAIIPTCVSTILSGRKKREDDIEDNIPNAYNEQGEPIDFKNLIAASRVSNLGSILPSIYDRAAFAQVDWYWTMRVLRLFSCSGKAKIFLFRGGGGIVRTNFLKENNNKKVQFSQKILKTCYFWTGKTPPCPPSGRPFT